MREYHVLIVLERSPKACRDKIAGIFSYADKVGNWVVECLAPHLPPDECRRRILSINPDGAIPVSGIDTNGLDCPVITIDHLMPDRADNASAVITCDDKSIGEKAAEILLQRGFRNFAYLGSDSRFSDGELSRRRYKAFVRAVRAGGGNPEVPSFKIGPYALSGTRTTDELQDWLKQLPKPCGLFAFCDFICLQLLVTCRRAGITIPDQLGVIGVDNELEICESASPTLSSIEPDFFGAGYRAAELLDRFMRHGKPKRQKHITYGIKAVHERLSTQNVAGPMRLVANISERIRLGATEGMSVASLAREFKISPRMLQYRFKNCLGIRVRDLLIKTRLDAARQMLETSDVPIESIFYRVGFNSSRRLKDTFAKRFGMSMRDWRKEHSGGSVYQSGRPEVRRR